MALTTKKRDLEVQQDITRKNTKEKNIGAAKLNVDPGTCPSCRHIKLACKCKHAGGGGEEKIDEALEKIQDQTNSQVDSELTSFKLILVSKEHSGNSECYEIQEKKIPQNFLDFFNAYLNRLAATQNKALADLIKEGFSGKIENDVIVLTFPNKKELEKFRQIAVEHLLPNILNPDHGRSVVKLWMQHTVLFQRLENTSAPVKLEQHDATLFDEQPIETAEDGFWCAFNKS